MPLTYELIGATTLSTTASTITISSIPATYTDLRVILYAYSGTNSSNSLRFNSNASNLYGVSLFYGDGTSVTNYSALAQTQGRIGVGGSYNPIPVMVKIDIADYSSSTKMKTYTFEEASNQQAGSTSDIITRGAGCWSNTAAITSITCQQFSGSYAAKTSLSVYGILKA